jgi:hypothetical protein
MTTAKAPRAGVLRSGDRVMLVSPSGRAERVARGVQMLESWGRHGQRPIPLGVPATLDVAAGTLTAAPAVTG